MYNSHRRKVMVIPYTDDGRVLMVRDRSSGEWGFVSGGVKKHEHPLTCAQRELEEETSGICRTIPSFHRRIETRTTYRPAELLIEDNKKGERVTSTYYIYLFRISDINLETFKENNEVDAINIAFYEDTSNTWEFCDWVYNRVLATS